MSAISQHPPPGRKPKSLRTATKIVKGESKAE